MQLPFFQREAGRTDYQEKENLKVELQKKNEEFKSYGSKLKSVEEELGRVQDELKMVTVERDNLKSMNSSFKNRLMEGGNMDMKDMMNNLLNIDPNEFRKTMNDLDYHGAEPMWSKIDFAETAGMARVVDEKDPGSLLAEIERLKRDKRDLAAELEKTQQMLKL